MAMALVGVEFFTFGASAQDFTMANSRLGLGYPSRTDLLFPSNHTDIFNDILKAAGLKEDREGQARVLYSLRHTYICLRLLDSADIYQLAKNCRTSVEMIGKNYAMPARVRKIFLIQAGVVNVANSDNVFFLKL